MGTGVFPGKRTAGVKMTIHFHLVARLRKHEAILLSSLMLLHGVVLNEVMD
jgi:hypothetical protein